MSCQSHLNIYSVLHLWVVGVQRRPRRSSIWFQAGKGLLHMATRLLELWLGVFFVWPEGRTHENKHHCNKHYFLPCITTCLFQVIKMEPYNPQPFFRFWHLSLIKVYLRFILLVVGVNISLYLWAVFHCLHVCSSIHLRKGISVACNNLNYYLFTIFLKSFHVGWHSFMIFLIIARLLNSILWIYNNLFAWFLIDCWQLPRLKIKT